MNERHLEQAAAYKDAKQMPNFKTLVLKGIPNYFLLKGKVSRHPNRSYVSAKWTINRLSDVENKKNEREKSPKGFKGLFNAGERTLKILTGKGDGEKGDGEKGDGGI